MDKELKTKSEMCRVLGWSDSFFDSVPLPPYHIGKRDYYKLSDVDIKSFSEICRYILQNNHVFPKFCQTGAIVERTLPC